MQSSDHTIRRNRNSNDDSSSFSVYASTWSSNMTMSDIVGAGRLLGKFYSKAGRALESIWRERASKAHSDAIDRTIGDDSRRFYEEFNILVLGSEGSGKSTIVKLMKIIHQSGYSPRDLADYRHTVYKNLIDSAQAVVLAMRKIGASPVMASNRMNADIILNYIVPEAAAEGWTLSKEVVQAIHQLKEDPIIPEIMDHTNNFHLMDSASYFFSEVIRIGSPTYTPTETDVLRAREKTTGIVETRIALGSNLPIRMFDVSSQHIYSKRWIKYFAESVTSIVFCAALSDYDQFIDEDNSDFAQNRLSKSLELFNSLVNSHWLFQTGGVVLILNKLDVLRDKVSKVPLNNYFPDYTGGPDMNKAVNYILSRFTHANRARLNVYPYVTQLTNLNTTTSSVQFIFGAIKETIMQNALRKSGIL